jgi:NTE family protein
MDNPIVEENIENSNKIDEKDNETKIEKEETNVEEINVEKNKENTNIDDKNINENILIDYDTLVLSGGSSKGIMTLGALQYLYDNFLIKNVKNYIGTSAGAMICYLLAIGYTPIEIIVYICKNQLLEKMQHFNIVAMINGVGAVSFNNIHEHLEKMTIEKIGYLPTISDLKTKFEKTFICATYNITEDKTEYISAETHPELPCLIALRMSSNLPLIFENYKYGNSFYIDGGISDNFPIDIGDKIGKKVLGILLSSKKENFNNDPDVNILEFIYKIMFIPISQITEHKILNSSEKCKIIRLNYEKLKFFNFNINSKEKLELFSFGYSFIKDKLEK